LAAPSIASARPALRVRIADRLDDNINGTASGGTATTMTDTGDIARLPTSPGSLVGSELSIITGTGSVESAHVTAHSKTADGVVTLTVPTWTAPDGTSTYEVHNLGARGFTKSQYDASINAAIDSMVDRYFTDTDSIPWGVEVAGSSAGENQGFTRHEYPMPTGYNYLWGVDYLGVTAATRNSFSLSDTYRAMGDATARTRLWQGFQVSQTGFYEYFALALNEVGTTTGTISIQVQTNSSGIPSGTQVTDSPSATITGSTLDGRTRYVVFRFDPPIFLTGATQYHIVLLRSNAVDSVNYYRWAEDDDNSYSSGTAGTYDGTTYTAVSGSDFCFAVFAASSLWIPYSRRHWEYRQVGADFIRLGLLPPDGTPIRLRGGSAIAEVSDETTNIPIDVHYVEAFAINYLLSGRVGKSSPDDYRAGALIWAQNYLARPRPTRSLPPNSVHVYV